MPDNRIEILFVDTSSLRRAGFRNPDFQKLLLRSKGRALRIVVSEIAWEEWRTDMRDKACKKTGDVRSQFEALKANAPSHRFLGRLPPPALALWDDADIDTASKAAMAEHAAENHIEVIPIGSDHGERAWRRYFGVKVEPPFNPSAKDRETRRKDIPDSWIFEAAVDLVAEGHQLAALCFDDNLAAALERAGVRVFREPGDIVTELERAVPQPEAVRDADAAAAGQAHDLLGAAIGGALEPFRAHERKVLGYVAYFDTPSKSQLISLLERSGMAPEIAKNAADRLVMGGLIRDTGHHYLFSDRKLAHLAASAVEDDIIKLLNEGPTNGL